MTWSASPLFCFLALRFLQSDGPINIGPEICSDPWLLCATHATLEHIHEPFPIWNSSGPLRRP
jgi:hypothetical protein